MEHATAKRPTHASFLGVRPLHPTVGCRFVPTLLADARRKPHAKRRAGVYAVPG